jgi:hypothetical protein
MLSPGGGRFTGLWQLTHDFPVVIKKPQNRSSIWIHFNHDAIAPFGILEPQFGHILSTAEEDALVISGMARSKPPPCGVLLIGGQRFDPLHCVQNIFHDLVVPSISNRNDGIALIAVFTSIDREELVLRIDRN